MLSFTSSGLPTSALRAFSWSSTNEPVFKPSHAAQPSLFAFCTLPTVFPTPTIVDGTSFESWNGKLPSLSLDNSLTPSFTSTLSTTLSSASSHAPSLRTVNSCASLASTAGTSLFNDAEQSFSSTSSWSSSSTVDDEDCTSHLPNTRPHLTGSGSTTSIGLLLSLPSVDAFKPTRPSSTILRKDDVRLAFSPSLYYTPTARIFAFSLPAIARSARLYPSFVSFSPVARR